MGKRKTQYFSSSQRWAIWTVYGMKCFKCSNPVDFDRCEIGRIIPDSVSKIVLASLVKDYELGNNFSVNDFSNLVPTCPSCNKSKPNAPFSPSSSIQSWFKLIRINAPMVEAKVKLIDGNHSAETFLKNLVEKLERGEVRAEDVERVVKPFMETVEGKPKGTVEFRLSDSARVFYSEEGLRMQPVSEIRYQKFVEGMVESGDWRQKKSVEEIREGIKFGEGGSRRPISGG